MMAELSVLLDASGETPAAAWRAKILFRSAQESDKELWKKLYDYEKTLLVRHKSSCMSADEMRTAQTSCMKLHRDFKRSHKALVMALSLYEKRQAAEVSRLGAVGWTNRGEEKKEEDFFDRTMRERDDELNRINKSMHHVAIIYKDLASLVEKQQEDIDMLDDDIIESRANVDAAHQEYSCMGVRQPFCGALPFDMGNGSDWEWSFLKEIDDWGFLKEADSLVSTGEEEKTTDSPMEKGSNSSNTPNSESSWYKTFDPFSAEFKDDWDAVTRDIVGFGKRVVSPQLAATRVRNSGRRQQASV
jgi:hypothetical protein